MPDGSFNRVGNRAHFDEAMQLSIEQNNRQPNGLTLMLVDLDNFKQINRPMVTQQAIVF